MKPPPFRYRRAESIDDALGMLAESGDEAKVLAGGQSLVPAMNFRIARPAELVDIDRLDELDYLVREDGGVRIGALRRHASLERDVDLPAPWSVLREAVAHVGHYPIRVRGTFGGSIAHADPAAELAVVVTALEGEVVARSREGERRVAAADLFLAPYMTSLAETELVVAVVLPAAPAGAVASFEEFAERAGDYALASVCAALAIENGSIAWVRIGLGSVGATPLRAVEAERALVGSDPDDSTFEAAAQAAARECDPGSDSHASAGFRRELVAVLTRRALGRAAAAATA